MGTGWWRIVAAVAALGALLLLGREASHQVPRFAAWVEGLGLWGPVVFAAGYAVATVAFVPGSLLTLAAGAVFGLLKGAATVFVGASAGATAAFLVSRYLAREAVERRLAGHPRLRAVDRAVGEAGFRMVLLLRLSPAFPFNLLNYALGLTRVSLRHYLLAHAGMLPGTFLYVYYGKVAGDLAAVAAGVAPEGGAGYWAVSGMGLAATVAVTTLVTRAARRALREATGT